VENSIQKRLFARPLLVAFHFLLAAAGGMLIGFLPEGLVSGLYYNSGIEPYSPLMALVVFSLGNLLSFRVLGLRAAEWTWILSALWLLVGRHELKSHWNPSWSPDKRDGDMRSQTCWVRP